MYDDEGEERVVRNGPMVDEFTDWYVLFVLTSPYVLCASMTLFVLTFFFSFSLFLFFFLLPSFFLFLLQAL